MATIMGVEFGWWSTKALKIHQEELARMDDQKLRESLEGLQRQIKDTGDVDDRGRQLLEDIDGDIHELLRHPDVGSVPDGASILGRLETAIEHLEASHPDLTMALSNLLNALNNAGI